MFLKWIVKYIVFESDVFGSLNKYFIHTPIYIVIDF